MPPSDLLNFRMLVRALVEVCLEPPARLTNSASELTAQHWYMRDEQSWHPRFFRAVCQRDSVVSRRSIRRITQPLIQFHEAGSHFWPWEHVTAPPMQRLPLGAVPPHPTSQPRSANARKREGFLSLLGSGVGNTGICTVVGPPWDFRSLHAMLVSWVGA